MLLVVFVYCIFLSVSNNENIRLSKQVEDSERCMHLASSKKKTSTSTLGKHESPFFSFSCITKYITRRRNPFTHEAGCKRVCVLFHKQTGGARP